MRAIEKTGAPQKYPAKNYGRNGWIKRRLGEVVDLFTNIE